MSGPSCEGNVDRYLSNDLETCNEVEIVSVEQREETRRKAREEGRASPSDDVIVVGCSSAGEQPQKGTGTATTSSNSEDDNAGAVRVDPVQRSDLQSCSSAQATRGEILFVEEVQTQTDKNDAPTGTTPQASGAAQDEARLREEGQQGHGRGKKKLPYSHKGRLHGHNEVKGRSVSPELPDSSFLPPAATNQSSSPSENISSLDILHSLPVVGICHRVDRHWSNGTPLYWTECTKCTTECTPTYHCVKVEAEAELDRVTEPLSGNKFCVVSVYRIQNIRLWKRYKCEMQLMLEEAHFGYLLNQAWLYHVTAASMKTVCEEGLDPRLSGVGRFGRGTYFRCVRTWCEVFSH